ncbi:MAG: hypothetical protein GEV09_15530 [Pseudonocardiaceae bacterium]|nr:hypothetical protein [Pseudonocardiaceae bacterium]
MPPETTQHARRRGQLTIAIRYARDENERDHARRELRTFVLGEHIKQVVDQAPPLTDEQRARLAALLRPTAGKR